MFYTGKVFKYAFWGATGLFFYHLLLVIYKQKPEEGMLVNAAFLDYAKFARF